jgi:nitroreductase
MTTKFDESIKYVDSSTGLIDAIGKRWSPRAFADKPVSAEQLKKLFTAASWAASSYNEQPWRFIVGMKGTDTFDKILKSLMPLNQAWAKNAPVLYASIAKKTFAHNGTENTVAKHDVGAASANFALQASVMNLYTHGMAGFDANVLRAEFQIPEDFDPVACWALGHLGDPDSLSEKLRDMEISKRQRKDLSEFVFSEWGKPAQL